MSPMPRIHIGLNALQGTLERYSKRFDLVELRPDPAVPIKPQTLRRWRKAVAPTFCFSIVLPSIVAELKPSAAATEALEHALEHARLLEAPIILLSTPASVTPTATNRKRLGELVARLPRDCVQVGWEPAGLWEPEVAQRIAEDLNLVLVRDAAAETLPRGPVVYTRLRGLGEHRRLSASRLDRVINSVRGRREVFVVIETEQAAQLAKKLREGVERASSEPRPRVAPARVIVPRLRAEDEEQ